MNEEDEVIIPYSQPDEVQVSEPEKFYYAGGGFYSSFFINTAYANGFKDEDLTEISEEDYSAWFNPPEGKYNTWVDGKPVLLDVSAPDYGLMATQLRDTLNTEANAATYQISLKIGLGRKLTVEETDKANAWMDYTDTLNALDFSKIDSKESYDAIEWPVKPA